jgi:hypothetical protein
MGHLRAPALQRHAFVDFDGGGCDHLARMRSATLVFFALLGLSVVVGCGSVAKNGGTGGNGSAGTAGTAGTAGGAGTSGAGGASPTDGGAGASGDGGEQSAGGVRLRGGIESVGPSSPDAGAVTTRIIRAGLTYSRARICNGSVCVAGGLSP